MKGTHMLANILNRSWKVSPEQAKAIVNDSLSRRKILVGGSMVCLGAALTGCVNGKIDIATLTPTLVQYASDIAAALKTALAALSSVSGLPPAVSSVLGTISSLVSNISSVASGISTSTLVSTATGSISAIVNDFNQIVSSIVANPVIQTALSATTFGWAVYAVPAVLSLLEQAVGLVTSIINPPAPTVTPVIPASTRWHARIVERVGATGSPGWGDPGLYEHWKVGGALVLDPSTADLILQDIAQGN
jgi:hypothetical protein